MLTSPVTFWEDLLEYIDEGRVIPIVGPELLRESTGDVTLHMSLARQLSQKLGVPDVDIPDHGALNHVIVRYMDSGGRREDVYPRIRAIIKESPPLIPEPLRQLASIRNFNLFVTTTFDSLLEQAINEVRFGGKPSTQTVVYRPADVRDLATEVSKLTSPVVFHLLGKLSAAPDYAVTDDDMLEFLSAMQNENGRPEVLFDELKNNHVLLLGCGFPDWLARFFIRLIKGGRLSMPRNSQEIIADQIARKDDNLVLFLKHFSYHTEVFAEGNAVEFVQELSNRYTARLPMPAATETKPDQIAAPEGEMPAGAIFLSYAHADLETVKKLRDALADAGIDVWFDRLQLEAGDLYDAKIRRHIRDCSLFLPIISANTQARLEGYFRKEWKQAAERTSKIYQGTPFIIPVTIDATRQAEALVPEPFLDAHWTRLPDGEPTDEFIARLVRLVRDHHKRHGGAA